MGWKPCPFTVIPKVSDYGDYFWKFLEILKRGKQLKISESLDHKVIR
jgi:hypothetical protein